MFVSVCVLPKDRYGMFPGRWLGPPHVLLPLCHTHSYLPQDIHIGTEMSPSTHTIRDKLTEEVEVKERGALVVSFCRLLDIAMCQCTQLSFVGLD